MAKTKIEVDLVIKGGESVEQVENKTKSLKAQLKEMKALLASGTLDNQAFNKLAREAGDLEDRIGDVSASVKNLASDTKNIDTLISATQGLVGGFSAVQGITAMLGTDNEALQETMVKLQGSMTALAGIQAVANTLQKESALMTGLTTIKTNAQGLANRFLTATTMESVTATYALRGALLASGIGAIIVLIGVAVSAMDKFTESTNESKNATDDLAESQEVLKNSLITTSEQLTQHDKFNIERSKLRGDAVSTQIKIEQDALQTQLYLGREDIKRIVASRDAYAVASEEYKRLDLEREERGRKNVAILNDLEFSKERYKFALDKEAQERKDKADEKSKKRAETKKELDDRVAKEIAEQNDRDRALENQLEEEKVDKYAKVRAVDAKNIKEHSEKKLFAIKKAHEQELKDTQDVENAKLSIVNDSYLAINALGELALGQQFKNTAVGKTLALAQIATDTAVAYMSGLRIAQKGAEGTGPLAPYTMPVFYASQVVAILGAVNKAKSILGGGGSTPSAPSGMGGGSSMSSQPPRLDTFQTNRTPMNANQRVYVLEKDITDSQGRVARIRHNATLI
jgi:hypothetical protein